MNISGKWEYDPKDFFEKEIHETYEKFELKVSNGVAKAEIDPKYIDKANDIIDDINKKLIRMFQAAQVMSRKKFKLSGPSRYDLTTDGKENVNIFVNTISAEAYIEEINSTTKDKDGNIVSDTKAERIAKIEWSSITAFRQDDSLLDQMLNSYQNSIIDPDNELIYLYEVRDAAKINFGNSKEAKKALRITKDEWDTLGKLANEKSFSQGRHRGLGVGELKKANISELEKARNIVVKIIENYMKYVQIR